MSFPSSHQVRWFSSHRTKECSYIGCTFLIESDEVYCPSHKIRVEQQLKHKSLLCDVKNCYDDKRPNSEFCTYHYNNIDDMMIYESKTKGVVDKRH
jgi:hypothetical protein